MNFPQFDTYPGVFHFGAESPLCDFQENGDIFGNNIYDSGWLNDDKSVPMSLKSTPSSPLLHNESQYPQRTSLLGIKKRKLSDLSASESLVTKTNHLKYKDDFLWDDTMELPEVILVSPNSETTPEPMINTVFNLDDEKTNNHLNLDFDDALQNVQMGVEMDYSVDLVIKEDPEYLDSLLDSLSDQQPIQTVNQDFLFEEVKQTVDGSDLNSFNEISCNINQGTVSDSQSAIKKLLKDDSFKGNFCKKKSTEILSEIDQSRDCFAEHNYFSPTKILKPRNERNETGECAVPCVSSTSAIVPMVTKDYVVETEISSSSGSFDMKTQTVLPQCSPKPAKTKQTKVAKSRDTIKKSKKPVLPKSPSSKSLKTDPTYTPYARKKLFAKKSQAPKQKSDKSIKKVAQRVKLPDLAKLPEVPLKTSVCESNSNKGISIVKPRVMHVAPEALPAPQYNVRVEQRNDPVPAMKPNPIEIANPRTPLASPTRDDIADQNEFTNQDSSRPETLKSNVDVVDPVQSIKLSIPKIEKKKISLKEYMKKRGTEIKTEPENASTIKPIESVTQAFVPNVEEILKTIVKSEPPPVDKILKPETAPVTNLVKSKPEPISATNSVKLEPSPRDRSLKPAVKTEPKPVVKSKPHPSKVDLIPKPPSKPPTEWKPAKEPQNNASFKLIKLVIPEKVPSVRSFSLSPNEVSQSLDSCDRYSSSGVSSYQNSSVSSTCGSPFTVHDEKSSDTKYSDNERIATTKSKNQTTEKKIRIPFAVDEELLRKKDSHSSRKHNHRKDKYRRSGSMSRKRKFSDSCFEEDSDCSEYSDRRHSRKRYTSTSSSSSDKSHHYRSQPSECSLSPRSCREYQDWKSSQSNKVPEPHYYPNFYGLPNMYFTPPPPSIPWHPDFGLYYPPFVPHIEVPYYFNSSHELPMNTGETEINRLALFVGNIESDLDERKFRKRFEKYGTITHVKLHFRENLSNYGFVYFTKERYVQRAIKHASEDPDLPHYKLGVGMRKDHRYTDRRPVPYEKKPVLNFPSQNHRDDPFTVELDKIKKDLKEKFSDTNK